MVEAGNLELKGEELHDYFGINEDELRDFIGHEESINLDLHIP